MKKLAVLFLAILPVLFLTGCTVSKSYVAQDTSKERMLEAVSDFAKSNGYYNSYSNDRTGIYGFTDKVFGVKEYNAVFSQPNNDDYYGRSSFANPNIIIVKLKQNGSNTLTIIDFKKYYSSVPVAIAKDFKTFIKRENIKLKSANGNDL